VNNVMSMGNLAVAAEAFTLGTKLGLDPGRAFEVLSRSGGRSHQFVKRMPAVLAGDTTARFALGLAEKDLRLALEMAHGVPAGMPITGAIHQVYELARAAGLGERDAAALVELYTSLGA
jgi:3-hydroxyisobutyrate dehydrogenase-like beta-hydroxyacid dehydrogenase